MLRDLASHLQTLPAEQRAHTTVVVLRQMGSHGPAYARRSLPTQSNFSRNARPTPCSNAHASRLLNAYNSILATDAFLDQAIEWLKTHAADRPTALLLRLRPRRIAGRKQPVPARPALRDCTRRTKHVPWIAGSRPRCSSAGWTPPACSVTGRSGNSRIDHYFHSVLGLLDIRTSATSAHWTPFCTLPKRRPSR